MGLEKEKMLIVKELQKLKDLMTYLEEKFPAYCKYYMSREYLRIDLAPVNREYCERWIEKPLRTVPHKTQWRKVDRLRLHLTETPAIKLVRNYIQTTGRRRYLDEEINVLIPLSTLVQTIPYISWYSGDFPGSVTTDLPKHLWGYMRPTLYARLQVLSEYREEEDTPLIKELRDQVLTIDEDAKNEERTNQTLNPSDLF